MLSNWKPSRIYYGWWIVGASVLVAMYAGGVVFYGFTAIFEPIANDMGWSYAQISLAASLRGLELGLLAPLTGILTDRLGPRRLIFSGALITAVGLFLLSQPKPRRRRHERHHTHRVDDRHCQLVPLEGKHRQRDC